MPAVMVGMQQDSPVAASDRKWLAGEILIIREESQQWGFPEMPINAQGPHTVAEANALNVSTIPLYSSAQMTDAGLVTSGTGADVAVVAGDIIVKQFGNYWINYGAQVVVPDTFFHIRVTDRTVSEVNLYLESYNKKLSYTSDQFNPPDDMRRWTTTNERVSVSGNNGFTAQGITDAIAEWNANHPSNQATLFDTDNLTFFQCDGIMPASLFDEWKENTQEVALSDYYAQRRWYIDAAGLTALSNNDWVIQGAAASVEPFLRDGLLD